LSARPQDSGRLRSRIAEYRLPGVGALARRYGIVLMFLLLFVVLSVASSSFLTGRNLLNILEQNAPIGIVALCTTPVLIAGGLDLSISAAVTICGIIAAKIAIVSDPGLGILVGVAAGAVVGFGNGVLSTVMRINSLIATLASGIVLSGIALLITNGFIVAPNDPNFANLGNSLVLGTTYGVWIFVLCVIVGQFILSKTTIGRKIYASGGNSEAARLSGIRVGWVLTGCFVVSGIGAALGGVIDASQVAQASPQTDPTLLFTALAGVVIGGTSVLGGEGAIWRTALGILFLALIQNGIDLIGISPNYQDIIEGAIILLAVGGDALARQRSPSH
jgi:ribose transport system permease protein